MQEVQWTFCLANARPRMAGPGVNEAAAMRQGSLKRQSPVLGRALSWYSNGGRT